MVTSNVFISKNQVVGVVLLHSFQSKPVQMIRNHAKKFRVIGYHTRLMEINVIETTILHGYKRFEVEARNFYHGRQISHIWATRLWFW